MLHEDKKEAEVHPNKKVTESRGVCGQQKVKDRARENRARGGQKLQRPQGVNRSTRMSDTEAACWLEVTC